MLYNLRQIKSSKLQDLMFKGDFDKLNEDELYWLEVKSDNRLAIIELLSELQLDENVLKHFREPKFSSRIHLFSGVVILNLPVTNTNNLGKTEYLTIFFKDNILITVIDVENTILDNVKENINSNPFDLHLTLDLVIYFMVSEILEHNKEITSSLKKRVNDIAVQMVSDRESVSFLEIINCRSDLSQLSSIVEDQYHLLRFSPKLKWEKVEERENIFSEMNHLFKGIEYVQRSLERQEDKIGGLQLQYQSMLQEKGNKRLNILTIVQAIFVPLTLIAGIYGMNFQHMPELNWDLSYFIILGIMGLLILFELWWFKKRGWFD